MATGRFQGLLGDAASPPGVDVSFGNHEIEVVNHVIVPHRGHQLAGRDVVPIAGENAFADELAGHLLMHDRDIYVPALLARVLLGEQLLCHLL